MKQRFEIRFHGMEASRTVELAVREKMETLVLRCADLIACRVEIELQHKQLRHGMPYLVRIDLRLPRHELTVSRLRHDDVDAALWDAFEGICRQLEDVLRAQRSCLGARRLSVARGEAAGLEEEGTSAC